jgi:hypothetical protein
MFRELLIGGAIVGGGGYYVTSNYMSADVVRTVKAPPHETWRGFNVLLNDYAQLLAETNEADQGGPLYKTKPVIVSIDSHEIDLKLMRDNKQVVRIHVRFEPLAGGRETKLMLDADVAADAVGNGKSMLASDFVFRQGLSFMVGKVAEQVESGKLVQVAAALEDMRRMQSDPRHLDAQMEMRNDKQLKEQEAAARPMLDPNAERVNPIGASVTPMQPGMGN